jgi:hypothetical protein
MRKATTTQNQDQRNATVWMRKVGKGQLTFIRDTPLSAISRLSGIFFNRW